MSIEEKIEKIKVYNIILDGYRKTAVMRFDSIEQKLEFRDLYFELYNTKVDLSCINCCSHALSQLEAWENRNSFQLDLGKVEEKIKAKVTFEDVIKPKEQLEIPFDESVVSEQQNEKEIVVSKQQKRKYTKKKEENK